MSNSPDAYATQADLVHDRLRHARARVLVEGAPDAARSDAVAATVAFRGVIEGRLAATSDRSHLPVTWLRDRLGLTLIEEDIIWLLAAHELDATTREQLHAAATEQSLELTVDMIRRAIHGHGFAAPALLELSPTGRLLQLGLLERTDRAGACATFRQTYRLAPRVLALIAGRTDLDDALVGIAAIAPSVRPMVEIVASDRAIAAVRDAIGAGRFAAVTGTPGLGRRALVLAAAHEAGRQVIDVDASALAADAAVAGAQLRAVARECLLLDAIPLVRCIDALTGDGQAQDRLVIFDRELVQRVPGAVFVTCRSRVPAVRWSRRPAVIEMAALSTADRTRLWQAALPEVVAEEIRVMAAKYPLAPALVHEAGAAIREHATGAEIDDKTIRRGIRTVLADRMSGLATRIDVTQSWNDLVLPVEQMEIVVELLARIEQRGRVHDEWGFAKKVGKGLGVAALFSGPPGTGKSMVAGLVGKDLGLDVYQVDLSRVVSKWIGETEKNLATLFDAAEAGHAVLLFDEADALFAKRTEVTSSNDRNANLEVNYLLQRLESFTGVCILTSNHERAIDDAFRRRLAVHVRFDVPDERERAMLWKAMVPAEAPVDGTINAAELAARFVMSGGHIRNSVLRAAFLAADGGKVLSQEILVQAAILEYEAMGRLVARPVAQDEQRVAA